jgi:hypothetical protein
VNELWTKSPQYERPVYSYAPDGGLPPFRWIATLEFMGRSASSSQPSAKKAEAAEDAARCWLAQPQHVFALLILGNLPSSTADSHYTHVYRCFRADTAGRLLWLGGMLHALMNAAALSGAELHVTISGLASGDQRLAVAELLGERFATPRFI